MKTALKTKNVTKKILVVDDEPAVCSMLKKYLTRKGHKASTALSGREAIRKIKKDRPHVVLLDIKMPQMDGIEVLKKIREIDTKIGIVMITAVKDDDVGRACMKMGAYDYITKPLSLGYLENVLMIMLFNVNSRNNNNKKKKW